MRYLVALQLAMDAGVDPEEIPCVYSLHKMSETFQHDSSLTAADFNLGGTFTKDAAALRSFIDQGLGHGGQIPEELTGALLAASYLPWTAQEKLAVIITDAPCHGKDYSSVVHDPFCDPKTGLTCTGKPEVPLRRFMSKGVTVVILHTGEAHTVSMCRRLQDTDPRLIHEKEANSNDAPLELATGHELEVEDESRTERYNTGSDAWSRWVPDTWASQEGLLFLGKRGAPKLTLRRPGDVSLDQYFTAQSDQVEIKGKFDGRKSYLLRMPAK
eukprot:g33251.t1